MAAKTGCPSKTGIKLFDYNVTIKTSEKNESKDDELKQNDPKTLIIEISYIKPQQKQPDFIDEFSISHKNATFLLEVVHTIFACFSKKAISNGFIKHNKDINSFEFVFESQQTTKSRLLSVIRTCSLPKTKYSKNEAIQKIHDSNSKAIHQYDYEEEEKKGGGGESSNNEISVDCINGHRIHDPHWELEVTLNVSPGVYHFHVDELFQGPIDIYVRDYIRIRDYYMEKLKDFYQHFKIFRVYLDHLEKTKDKFIWTKMGFEAGPMRNLHLILKQIKSDDDSIWNKLFDLCLIDVYETDDGQMITINSDEIQENGGKPNQCIADFITEQSIANFIALSIKYYCLDRKIAKDKNVDLSKELTDCDKYLLSIVLPYFDIKAKKYTLSDDKIQNIPLISGLFNRFVNFYEDNQENRNNKQYEKNWKMNIDATKLKTDLLLHLNRMPKESINVVKNTWKFKKNEESDKLEYSLIEDIEYKYDDLDETKEERVDLNALEILKCYDTSYEYEWVMWTNKGLKRLYQTSKGYWKILNEQDEHPRIPIKHLNCMRSLIITITTPKNTKSSEKQPVSTDFKDGVTVKIYDNINGKTETMTAQYTINIWKLNNPSISTTSLSIKIIKAFDPVIDGKTKIKKRDSHFLYFKPKGDGDGKGIVEWAWYNNDRAKYEEYNLGQNVTKQIEATYQGVQEYNFALNKYHRGGKNAEEQDERLFIDAQLTELSNGMVSVLRLPYKPFVLRFTFGGNKQNAKSGKLETNVINMEQVAINSNDGNQFPRNIRRLQTAATDDDNTMIAVDDDVDHRIYSLGNMNINILNDKVMINWIFEQDEKNHIKKNHYFAASIDMKTKNKNDYTDLVKNALELWRANSLFDQHQFKIIYSDTSNLRSSLPIIGRKDVLEPRGYSDLNEEKKQNEEELPANYKGIINSKLLNGVHDKIWAELDKMDDGLKCEEKLVVKLKEKHKRDRFNEKVFTLVSLQKIQSIISVLKQQIQIKGNKLTKEFNDKPLIIAVSNQQLLFDYETKNIHTTKFNKSMSYIFDTQSFIKRIDSKGTIYDIKISDFEKNIVNKHYLHDFMAVSSKVYKSTIFIFKRPKCNNLYISHNGFIRKLSLSLYNEDLYYFLPSFITLQVGSFIDIESFCYPDCGTIIKCIKSKEKDEMIYYKIRSSQNVFYTLNYYQITNRSSPNQYYTHCRKALIDKDNKLKNLLLWNKNMMDSKRDPSDTSHPLHIISLSLLESSKQAIAAIDYDESIDIKDVQNKLKQSGIIYLLYRTVHNKPKSENIKELLQEQKDMMNDKDFNKKTSKLYIEPLVLKDFEDSISEHKDKRELDELIGNLEKKKLISNKEIINKDMTYNNLVKLHQAILASNNNNNIYIIHITEARELVTVDDDDKPSDIDKLMAQSTGGSENWATYVDEEDGDSDEDWLVMEPDENTGELKQTQKKNKQRIEVQSTFQSKIEYKYEMARVYSSTKTVEDLMTKYRNTENNDNIYNQSNKWTMDENRLLTFFYNKKVYNEYDLNDKNIVHKLRTILYENCNQPRFIKLYKKFEEFIKRVNENNKLNENNKSYMRSVNNCIINGAEITRNAVLLQQQYINNINNKEKEEEEKKEEKKEEKIAINKTMVITYNPLQSCVVTNNSNKDITHPIHIYRSAYSKDLRNFYNDFGLKQLYNGWMNQPDLPQTVDKLYQQNESVRPKVNVIDTLSLLIRYNKKYEIVLIPSSIYVNKSFLNDKCNPIAPDIDAVSKYRVTFIYKGILYNHNKGGIKKDKDKEEKQEEEKEDNKEEEDDEDRFFLDEIKFLVRKIKENIIEDSMDCMDPPYFENAAPKKGRLRSWIKRNNKDIMLRWLKIGCGSCFLHEPSGRQNEIGPPLSGDYDRDFPDLLKQAMFIYYIDCKIPFKEDSSNNTCDLCANYMINPTTISKSKACKHSFCEKCVIQWKEMINNPDWGTMKENYDKNEVKITELIENPNNDKVLENIILPKYCPLYNQCHVELGDIEIDKKSNKNDNNLPITVYQQLLEENDIRYYRLNLLNRYQQKREVQLQRDQNNLSLQKLRDKYPNIDAILSGYQ